MMHENRGVPLLGWGKQWLVLVCLVGALLVSGCQNGKTAETAGLETKAGTAEPESATVGVDASAFAKDGFVTRIEDGRLWVLRPGEEISEKHITQVGKGPAGMTIKALDRECVLAYLAAKPGFKTEIEDGRVWVLRKGEEKSEKHVSLIGVGPMGMTVKALTPKTAREYVASKPGFKVEIEDGRLWVLRPGEEKSEKHVTLVGAGPMNMTVMALDKKTALEYLASKPGFAVDVDADGRIWVFRLGEKQEKSEKHVTRVAAGPLGEAVTLKALSPEILDAYAATQG